jgi:hypothetical protein
MNLSCLGVTILSLVAAPALAAGSLKEGSRFEWNITNETTRKTSSWQEIILQIDADKIATRSGDIGSPTFILTLFDRQLRVTESGIWAYSPGNCSGIPTQLEVGSNETFDTTATVTDVKANTKNSFVMNCTSKVVGTGTKEINGKTLDVVLVENVASYNMLVNGAPATYEVSGAYAPQVGWWVSKSIKESQRGITTNKVTFVLQQYSTD